MQWNSTIRVHIRIIAIVAAPEYVARAMEQFLVSFGVILALLGVILYRLTTWALIPVYMR